MQRVLRIQRKCLVLTSALVALFVQPPEKSNVGFKCMFTLTFTAEIVYR